MKTIVFAFVGAAAALSGPAVAKEPAFDTLIAHRGESIDAPENTLPAYRTAVARGFGFECDIYLSKDKRLFTFHDGTLARTTGGAHTEACTNASWENVVSKANVGGWGRWKGSAFDPTRPALLSEVLDLARDGRWIYVEVKGNDPSWVPYIKAEFAKSKTANPGNVLFISFGDEVLAELKRQMPEYRAYWLTSCRRRVAGELDRKKWPVQTPEAIIAKLREIGADGVDISFSPDVIDAAFVKAVKAAGYSFHVWTVDDPARAKAAFAAGADTLTTNRAKELRDAYEAEKRVPAAPASLAKVGGKIAAVRTVPHELDVLLKTGHIQGAACSEEGVYLAHQGGIEMVGWDGRLIRRVDAPSHLGDVAYADGKVYGAFVLRGPEGKGKLPGMVRVWNARLEPLAEKRYPEPLDGIVVLGKTIYVGVDRWGHGRHPLCSVKRLDLDLNDLGNTDVDLGYEIHYGVQTMATDGKDLFFGCYGGTSRVSPDLKTNAPVKLDCSEGFGLVPKSVAGQETPLFFVVKALGGNMQGWRKAPEKNPPRISLRFHAYENGAFADVTARR